MHSIHGRYNLRDLVATNWYLKNIFAIRTVGKVPRASVEIYSVMFYSSDSDIIFARIYLNNIYMEYQITV